MLPQSVQADVAGVLIWYSCLVLTPCVHYGRFLKLGKHPQAFWAALDTSGVKPPGQRLTEIDLRRCRGLQGTGSTPAAWHVLGQG